MTDNLDDLAELTQEDDQEAVDFCESNCPFIPESMKRDRKILHRVANLREKHGHYRKEHDDKFKNTFLKFNENRIIFEKTIEKYSLDYNRKFTKEEVEKIVDIFILAGSKSDLVPFKIDNYLNRYDIFYESFKEENLSTADYFDKVMNHLKANYHIDFKHYNTEIAFLFYTHILRFKNFFYCDLAVYSDFGEYHSKSLAAASRQIFQSITSRFMIQRKATTS